jgi:trehalose synthase
MTAAAPQPATFDVPTAPLAIERFRAVLDDRSYDELLAARAQALELLRGHAIWCVNSTAQGGGVAEMLRSLLSYSRGAGVDARWVVVRGSPAFFTVTKRLHNRLHGSPGDGGPLGDAERAVYEATLAPAARELEPRVRPGDVVILHDPQTVGLTHALRARGARVVWRAHIGVDRPNDLAREAWAFLRPALADADAIVFSHERFVWQGLDDRLVTVIPPSIDVFSPKNQPLGDASARAILAVMGLSPIGDPQAATFLREDGSPARVERRAELVQEQPLRGDERLVVQVSRWDRLKDPVGVLQGFVGHAGECCDAHLLLAGPSATSIADDPEGVAALDEVVAAWRALPKAARMRVHLACLPMDDPDENAAMVNALQTRADVIVQKSLAEGFGLTVSEAMWKARPVLASGVGGIQDQIVDEVNGLVLHDPTDLAAFGHAICRLLSDPALAARLGAAAHEQVRARFLESRHLEQWVALIARLGQAREPSVTSSTIP